MPSPQRYHDKLIDLMVADGFADKVEGGYVLHTDHGDVEIDDSQVFASHDHIEIFVGGEPL